MSAFPQELYDIVISLCDRRSLASCSLVCRNWVPCSRMGYFSNLRPLTISPSSLQEVLLLVDGPVSTISPYIKSLILKDWDVGSSSQSFYAALPRITGRMTAVESLAFYAVDWEEMADGALNFLVFYFKNTLKSLELRDSPYRTFDGLVDLTCSFPFLEKLSLHRLVAFNRSEHGTLGPRRSPPPSAPQLRSIYAFGSIKRELVRWILKTNLDIEEVTFGPILPREARVVGKFLGALKNNLKHLTLSGESVPNMHREISLKHNRQLTSIHFANLMLHHRGINGGRASTTWFIHLLHAIQSSSLQSLRFSACVHSQSVETLEVIDWLALSTCLDKPQFVCLASVTFSFSMSHHKDVEGGNWWNGYTEMAENFVRERLPQFRSTGILGVDFERVGDVQVVESDDDL